MELERTERKENIQWMFLANVPACRAGVRLPQGVTKKPPEKEAFKVEPEGVEPSSKRATAPLSTCLVFVQVLDPLPVKNHQRRA